MTEASSGAQIFDRGYRRYDGPRTGMKGAVRSLVTHSMQRCLGIHRSARFKIVPAIVILLAYVPAIIYMGIAALLPSNIGNEVVPPFYGYFGQTSTALFLFASFTGPELLCTDRRTGMLGVYLSSPLTRRRYLAAKFLAISLLMLLVALLPNLAFFTAITSQGGGPQGFWAFISTLLQITVAAVMIAVYYAAISMAVSATTDRVAVAIASTIGVLVGSSIISSITTDLGWSTNYRLLNLFLLPIQLAPRIFGETPEWSENPTWTMVLAWFAVVVGCLAWVGYRYQRLQVRR